MARGVLLKYRLIDPTKPELRKCPCVTASYRLLWDMLFMTIGKGRHCVNVLHPSSADLLLSFMSAVDD